jgi:hypothetical protein
LVEEINSAILIISIATSAVPCEQWLTIFAPILISFSFKPVFDRLGRRQRAQEIAEIVSECVKLETDGVGGE